MDILKLVFNVDGISQALTDVATGDAFFVKQTKRADAEPVYSLHDGLTGKALTVPVVSMLLGALLDARLQPSKLTPETITEYDRKTNFGAF